MKKIIASVAFTIMAVLGIASFATLQSIPVSASGLDEIKKMGEEANDGNTTDLMPMIQIIINVVLGVIGLICVVMIILGGITFTSSQGNPDNVKKGKDMILYSIIGLVVALLAFAIVNFVLVNIFGK